MHFFDHNSKVKLVKVVKLLFNLNLLDSLSIYHRDQSSFVLIYNFE